MCRMKSLPPEPPLHSAGLRLRFFDEADASAVSAACADPAISRFTFMKEGLTEEDVCDWIARGNTMWADGHPRLAYSFDPEADRLLGQIGMAVSRPLSECGGVLLGDGRRSEDKVLHQPRWLWSAYWALEHDIERLYLLIDPENAGLRIESPQDAASLARVSACVRKRVKGDRRDLVSWSLLPGDPRPWRSA